MKYLKILSLLIFLLSLNLYGQVVHTVNFTLNDLITTDVTGADSTIYTKVTYDELRFTDKTGKPELPVRYVNLIIPYDQEVSGISFTLSGQDTINISHLVYPAQTPIPTLLGFEDFDFVEPDPLIYGSQNPYPAELVVSSSEGYFDGVNHIVTLAVYPVEYYPSLNKLIFSSTIEITLEMQRGSQTALDVNTRTVSVQEMYDDILTAMVENPEDISAYKGSYSFQRTDYAPGTYEYIIITTDALKDYFNDFIEWKKRKGITIGLVTVEYIISHYAGDLISGIYDDAGKIRQYLKDAYENGTVWALLAGDYATVPIRYGCGSDNVWNSGTHCSGIERYKIPADLYFADFNGDWDVDGTDPDGQIRYGERMGDDPDYNPEIFVGRLLTSNSTGAQDIANWTAKLIRYEKNPGDGDFAYLNKSFMTVADHMQDWYTPNQAQQVADHLPNTFTHTILKEEPNGSSYSPTFPAGVDVIDEINSQYGLVSWFNHAAPAVITVRSAGLNETTPRWIVSTTDDFTGQVVPENGNGLDNLTNSNYPAILYSIGCDNTPFDDYDPCVWYPGRNMGEGWTVMTDGGGPAFLGNTRVGWVATSYLLYKKFADLITSGGIDPESGKSYLHLGVAELVSKQLLNDHYLSYTHNLIGCPETQMWADTPLEFTGISITDNKTSITVATGTNGCNINVKALSDGETYNNTVHNVSGYTFITSVRPLLITITKSQYLPYTIISGGTLNNDFTINENVKLYGKLTVPIGKTLTIDPGIKINLSDNSSLELYGTLNAVGTTSNKITFDKEGTPTTWSLVFKGTNSSSSILNNVEIKNGAGIQCKDGANMTIQNSLIDHCTHGIYIYEAAPNILHNSILDPYGNGIYGETLGYEPLIKENTIKKITNNLFNYEGIYFTNNFAASHITGNDIQGFDYGFSS